MGGAWKEKIEEKYDGRGERLNQIWKREIEICRANIVGN